MKKEQLNEWVHQLVSESNIEIVKEIQLGETTVRLGKTTDANFHKMGGGTIVQLVSNVGSVGLDKRDVRALISYIKKMMGYSYMPRLKEDYNNSEWEVYVADEGGKEKVVKVAKSKRAAVILYNKLIKSDDYWEVGMKVKGYNEGITKEDIELGKVYTDKDRPPFQTNEEKLNEGDIDKKVDTKIVAQRVLKDFKGQYTWVGKAWVKELLKKYPKGISQTDFIIDAENLKNTFGGHIGGDRMFKGLNEQKLEEKVVSLPSGIKADLDTLKGLTIFTLKGKPIKFDRQQLAMFLRSVGKHMGIK